jgi:hypothetical protein
MPENTQTTSEDEVQRAILDLTTEDWYGLWEIYNHVAKELGRPADVTLREQLRRKLGEMLAGGLLDAAIWSAGPPRTISSDMVRALPIDSDLWGSPENSVEQLRITATDAGDQLYFGESKKTSG